MGDEVAFFRAAAQPLDDTLVRWRLATDKPVLAASGALYVELLAWLDIVLVPNFNRDDCPLVDTVIRIQIRPSLPLA